MCLLRGSVGVKMNLLICLFSALKLGSPMEVMGVASQQDANVLVLSLHDMEM